VMSRNKSDTKWKQNRVSLVHQSNKQKRSPRPGRDSDAGTPLSAAPSLEGAASLQGRHQGPQRPHQSGQRVDRAGADPGPGVVPGTSAHYGFHLLSTGTCAAETK